MIRFTIFNPADDIILCNGTCPDETCYPFIPEGWEVAPGIQGDPETQKLRVLMVDGEKVYSLYTYVRDREPDELIAAIEDERKRRLSAGFDYNFGDARGTHRIGTTDADEKHWDKVTKLAQAYINAGQPNREILVVTDTGPVTVTAVEWQHILIAAGEFQQPIYQASFQIQAMNPTPQDVENPEYWQ